ncbi:MAG: SpoIIE family protein phosphatase [Bacteroidota bacterium]
MSSKNKEINLAQISSINKRINSTMSLNGLLSAILDITKTMINSEGASILLTDPVSDDLYFYVVRGGGDEEIMGETVPQGKGIAGSVMMSGEPLIVNDPHKDKRFYREIDNKSRFKTRNILCVPMKVIDTQIGVLEVVNSIGRDGFEEWDQQLLSYIADQAAIAITNRQLYDDLSTRLRELTTLYEISQTLAHAQPEDNIFSQIMEPLSKNLGVSRISIALHDPDLDSYTIVASMNLPKKINMTISDYSQAPVIHHVCTTGDPLLVSDIKKETSFNQSVKNRDYNTPSFMSLPLRHKNRIIGVLNLSDKIDNRHFTAFDFRAASTIANHITEAYQNTIYYQTMEEQRRLAQEIDIASEIQKRILPALPLKIHSHSLAAFNKPAKEVGGDFYDYFPFEGDKFGILVADISGKGIPAALFMGTARNVIRAESRMSIQPGNLLAHSNRYICEDSEYGMFVTVFYMLVDSHNNLITYGNAGHNDQILLRPANMEVVRLNAAGPAMGINPDALFEEKAIFFNEGDIILLFTDGVLEYLGEGDIDIGEARLISMAFDAVEQMPSGFITNMEQFLHSHRIDKDVMDDFTIVAIKF